MTVDSKTNGMKYSSINRPEDFELHDAELSLVSWNDYQGKAWYVRDFVENENNPKQ